MLCKHGKIIAQSNNVVGFCCSVQIVKNEGKGNDYLFNEAQMDDNSNTLRAYKTCLCVCV